MECITDEQKHSFLLDIEKFTLFANACLANMKERFSQQEDLCERKAKQIKDDKIMIAKLKEYEKVGMDFYLDASKGKSYDYDPRVFASDKEEKIKDDKPSLSELANVYQENPYQLMLRWILHEIQEI